VALSVQVKADAVTQRDGSRWVKFIYSDAQGVVKHSLFRSFDDDATLAAEATASLDAMLGVLADHEAHLALLRDEAPTLRFQTGAEFLGRLRAFYRDASREDVCSMAQWIRNRVAAGEVTTAQLRNAWGLSQAAWDALKTKMDGYAANLEAVQGAEGE
jgi:hypothetical protein